MCCPGGGTSPLAHTPIPGLLDSSSATLTLAAFFAFFAASFSIFAAFFFSDLALFFFPFFPIAKWAPALRKRSGGCR